MQKPNPKTTNPKVIKDVGDLIRSVFAADERAMGVSRYSMVICKAGHHLTGEGLAPTECPICKEQRDV